MGDLNADQKAYVRRVVSDPVLFATHILGAELWEREADILRSIQTNRRTAIRACHGAGKTYFTGTCGPMVVGSLPARHRLDDLSDSPPGQNSGVGGDSSHLGELKNPISGVKDD
jgi:hypothetical protein